MLNETRGRVEELTENFNKETGNIKKRDRKHKRENGSQDGSIGKYA